MSGVRKIRTAVIAAAGLGTRFLPQTKAMPKEMLPIIDKPVIQYVVEELVDAGIEDIVIVTGYHKRSIEDHFDSPSRELLHALSSPEKADALAAVEEIAGLANFAYLRQKGHQGNGTPLLNAARLIGDEPFIYTFGDDFVTATPSRFRQMTAAYERTGLGVISCIAAQSAEDYERYGFVSGERRDDGLVNIASIVEKPGSARAPSNLASVSSYLLPAALLDYLRAEDETLADDAELSLQAALQRFIDDGNALLALEVANARYHDSGNKLEYLKTIIEIGLANEEIGPALREFLVDSIGLPVTPAAID